MTGNDTSRQTAPPAQRAQRGSLFVTFIGGALLGASVFLDGDGAVAGTDRHADGWKDCRA